jgi:sugar phosphate isomerase/epimerase
MISITNLSWKEKDEAEIFKHLNYSNIEYIEVSLTKQFIKWENITHNKLKNYKNYLLDNNLKISALQSIFYGIPYNVFRQNLEFTNHFLKILEYSSELECDYVVFGSPRNRFIGELDKEKSDVIFSETIRKISNYFPNIKIGIEANPKYYNCDYLYNFIETDKMIRLIESKNVVYHLDTGCATLACDSYRDIYDLKKNEISYIHISTKDLMYPLKENELFYFLEEHHNSKQFFSIEMLNQDLDIILKCIKKMEFL